MSTGYTHLIVEFQKDILWLRINRPASRNALSVATLGELSKACLEHAATPSLRAAVIVGEGPDSFAAGGDLKELESLREPPDIYAFCDTASAALDQIRRFPVIVVAALNGCALGGGAELALACDFRVAHPSASIGYIQARLGISCGFGGGADLMRLLGPSAGLLGGLRADVLDAHRAHELGLVDDVAGASETLQECVERFLAPMVRQSPGVIRAYKAMAIAEREGGSAQARRAVERDWFVRTWTTPEHWAAVDAFMQRKVRAV